MTGIPIDDRSEEKFFRSVVSIFIMCLMGIAALIWWQGCNHSNKQPLPVEDVETVRVDSVANDTVYEYTILMSQKLDSLIPYEGRMKSAFVYHVQSVAKRLDIPASWLFSGYFFESGMHYNAANRNESGDTIAYGLLQWTKSSCAHMGISLREVFNMGLFEQVELTYVWISSLDVDVDKGFDEFYLANYLPYYRSKPDHYQIDSAFVAANPIGNTIGEFRNYANRRYGKINQT